MTVSGCQISEMAKAGQTLNPKVYDSCMQFGQHVRNVQAAIIHTFQIISYAAIREPEPGKAALMWKAMNDLCDHALRTLKHLKDVYPNCGAPELYDLTLDYKSAAYQPTSGTRRTCGILNA